MFLPAAVTLLLAGSGGMPDATVPEGSMGTARGAHEDECGWDCDPGGADYSEAPRIRPAPLGGLALREATDVRLRVARIDVRLSLEEGAFTKREIRARYDISNPGAARPVRVGFRFTFGSNVPRVDMPPPVNLLLRESSARINGSAMVCEPFEGISWSATPRTSTAEGWCTTSIHVAAGESTLTFEGTADPGGDALWFVPAFRYPVAAEASWRGPVDLIELAVTVEGWAGPIAVLTPDRPQVEAGRVKWTLDHPDLGRTRTFAFYLPPGERTARTRQSSANAIVTYAARASTTLAPQGHFRYDPAAAADGDHSSAWCEGAPGAGIGQWLEVAATLQSGAAERCSLLAFAIIPGYAHSRSAWLGNGRVQRLRIDPCGRPHEGFDVTLGTVGSADHQGRPRLASDPWDALLVLDAAKPPAGARSGAGDAHCFRLSIQNIAPGKDADTCVSEFLPVLRCDGARAP